MHLTTVDLSFSFSETGTKKKLKTNQKWQLKGAKYMTTNLNRPKAEQLSKEELKRRIKQALLYDWGETAFIAANINAFIDDNYDDVEELLDDLECPHDDCELVDHMICQAGIDHRLSQKVHKSCILAVNGLWKNENVPLISNIMKSDPYDIGKEEIGPLSMSNHVTDTQEWMVKQWDYGYGGLTNSNLDLIKLYAIARAQNLDTPSSSLPLLLNDVYQQLKINYLIDRKRKGKDVKYDHYFSDFVRKSKAFNKLNEKNKQIIISAIGRLRKWFPPVIFPPIFFQIEDSLYESVLYTYIMSGTINDMINTSAIELPLQIDLWIIPEFVTFWDDDDDESSTSRNSFDEKKQIDHRLCVLFNIEQMLKLDDVNYQKFDVDCRQIILYAWIKQYHLEKDLKKVIPLEIIAHIIQYIPNLRGAILPSQLLNDMKKHIQFAYPSRNRLVCIVDRRREYYDFKVLGNDHKQRYRTHRSPYFPLPDAQNELQDDDEFLRRLRILEVDENARNTKINDQVFIFQPPGKYGHFDEDYSQEHLQYLSREYMLPPAIVCDRNMNAYRRYSGTYNLFESQMFAISFCCHDKENIRLQWFINGWSMRISRGSNFTKIWPEYFEGSQQRESMLERIQSEILSKWKLPIRDKHYAAYEKDLMRFERKKSHCV